MVKLLGRIPTKQKYFATNKFHTKISIGEFSNYGNYTIINNRSQNIAGYVTLYVLGQVGYFSLLENTTEYLRYYYHSQCFIAKVLSDLSK